MGFFNHRLWLPLNLLPSLFPAFHPFPRPFSAWCSSFSISSSKLSLLCHAGLQMNTHRHAEIRRKDSDVICSRPGSMECSPSPPQPPPQRCLMLIYISTNVHSHNSSWQLTLTICVKHNQRTYSTKLSLQLCGAIFFFSQGMFVCVHECVLVSWCQIWV